MINTLDPIPNSVNTYKLKRWVYLSNIFALIFMGTTLGPAFAVVLLIFISMFKSGPKFSAVNIIFLFFLVPLIVLISLILVQLLISIISPFFSYIKLSSVGLEQKIWPFKHIRCNWSDVDKLGKIFLFNDVIFLNSYEILGFSLSLKSPFNFLHPKQGFISLTNYEGWSDGQLANDLKQYAPKLFENQLVSQETQPENKAGQEIEASFLSQEVRLLAAISHASIIFTNVGFFIPIGIYLTQKKKSSYLSFQALQAFIWQIIMVVFSTLTSSCMVSSIFIPALLATSSQNQKLLELSAGGMFFGLIISAFLIIFGNLAFIIYSIIGTIMTYQGKDFRYIFIGNRIEKSKISTPINRD